MNIGDRVRLVHGNEEGIISKILDNNLIEVEIEDGFRIPVRRAEIAIVSLEETARFGSKIDLPAIQDKKDAPILSQKGIYTAYVMLNDKNGALYLLNNTDFDMPFVIGREMAGKYQAIRSGVLPQRNVQKVEELLWNDFDNWGTFVLQLLFYRAGHDVLREPLTRKIKYRANTFLKTKVNVPLLNKEGYLMQIDEEIETQTPPTQELKQVSKEPQIDVIKLKEAMLSPTEASILQKNLAKTIKKPASEVDLHIEILTKDHANLNTAQMLELQLDTFEKALESAIATGMKDIIFIHGVGSGKLRTEIHKRLNGHPDISFFADARKEKFGYGATEVNLK